MPSKNKAGCTCCGETPDACVLLSDDFDRADDTDIGANWTEVSGSWSISSNELASLSGLVISTVTHTNQNVSLSVVVRGATGAKFRLIFGYVDTNNYWFIEVEIGGNLSLVERASGSNTTHDSASSGTSAATDYTLSGCMSGLYFVGNCNTAHVEEATTATSGSFGLGIGATGLGTPKFDDFLARKVESGCDYCLVEDDCTGLCDPFTVPGAFEVTIAGLTNDGCSDCTSLNGTYVLTQIDFCTYRYYFTDPNCGTCFGNIQLTIGTIFNGTTTVRALTVTLAFYDSDPCPDDITDPSIAWNTDVIWTNQDEGIGIDCTTDLVGIVIDFSGDDDIYCDGTGSTATITAL